MFQNVYHKYSTNSLDYMNSTQVSKLTGRTNREKTKKTTPSQDSFVLLAILFVCLFVCLFYDHTVVRLRRLQPTFPCFPEFVRYLVIVAMKHGKTLPFITEYLLLKWLERT